MRLNKYLILILLIVLLLTGRSNLYSSEKSDIDSISVELSSIIVKNTDSEITISLYEEGDLSDFTGPMSVKIDGKPQTLDFNRGECNFKERFQQKQNFRINCCDDSFERQVNPIPLWMGIIPPLIAILFALLFKEVFSALALGIFSGTLIISTYSYTGFFKPLFYAFIRFIDTYIIHALKDTGHLSIIVFSMLIGGIVGIISKNGGMRGIVAVLSKRAKTSRSGQLATWIMGIAIFFDDYANTLVVGNTMRSVTDKLKISREKLAYIVDSTAAPIASIAFITTWIGAELGYIQDGITKIGLDTNPYSVFFASLKYSFYPILALLFVLFIVLSRRDYGPMYKSELNARKGIKSEGQKEASKHKSKKSAPYNALIPVLVIIFGTLAGLIFSGWNQTIWDNADLSFGAKLSHIIGGADSFKALLWSSMAGILVAIILTVSQKLLNLKKTIEAMIGGFKQMLTAILILTFAWALALLTEHLHTAEFIGETMKNMAVSPYLIPAISFVFSALIAFSTGSSWGTMAIMYPLILPSSWMIFSEAGLDHATSMMLFNNLVSTVIAGSVLGDHCSPISDTTILSSLASGCPHIQHVKTQMPYALTAGTIALLAGTIPAAYGFPVIISFAIGISLLILSLKLFGKKLPITKL